ncbi:hypothetical protein D0T49_01995 [Paludibacter sp. 221]|uniref:hypothetical protein n=1 Tax=Paludibacter sp. 221 TaxID=2302939 RepID=UPI0013D046DC|nr:hypothetical protein [Paludibacter sp. 221]NDV45822.1 hypothetical protein [Paludibacter sp. 221]
MDTINLIHHRPEDLNDFSWYEEYEKQMGEKELRSYVNKVYGLLMDLPEGESFSITAKVDPRNYNLFIKAACLFISEQKAQNFEFNSKFTEIRHIIPHAYTKPKIQEQCTTIGENISNLSGTTSTK